MTLIPKSPTSPFPPGGGFSYREPKTGRFFDGMLGNVDYTARQVIAYKAANPHIFTEGVGDFASTVQLIYAQKFETMPWLFVGQPDKGQSASLLPALQSATPAQAAAPAQLAGKQCSCGANDWKVILCKSCGNGKISGYVCNKCGKKR